MWEVDSVLKYRLGSWSMAKRLIQWGFRDQVLAHLETASHGQDSRLMEGSTVVGSGMLY